MTSFNYRTASQLHSLNGCLYIATSSSIKFYSFSQYLEHRVYAGHDADATA